MARKSIVLIGDPVRKERNAAAAITPGHLIELTSADTVQVHANAGQNAQRAFAIEDELQGAEIGDAYSTSNRVLYGVFQRGMEVFAILADGQNASIGDMLESNGNGELRVHSGDSAGIVEYPEAIVGVAKTAVDASDSAATAVASRRIVAEIL